MDGIISSRFAHKNVSVIISLVGDVLDVISSSPQPMMGCTRTMSFYLFQDAAGPIQIDGHDHLSDGSRPSDGPCFASPSRLMHVTLEHAKMVILLYYEGLSVKLPLLIPFFPLCKEFAETEQLRFVL